MKFKRSAASAALATSVAAAIVFGTVGPAQANTNADSLGEGVPNINYGSGVWCVQYMLNRMDNAGLAEDSSFGPATAAAVRVFQATHHYSYHLTVDGVVGPKTGTEMLDQWKYVFHKSGGWGGYCGNWLPTTH
ncbi:peptidoglycan-binding domain-containing protein [Streptantibioticus ferralitis]|uniref:Peptidoglycan-binding domain-containing protein n=1 Tax=Streptantibioticus ferralitis TaxID=236510 RepID=A0ABT5Z761_9ACTN|nr:peptidoglycan-binding domain-containing protein [Streptantibioticus ferralitis]MDF2258870.1 peptidoglycan-binding domain-containing protein [Streptantibioticus ferralitis]